MCYVSDIEEIEMRCALDSDVMAELTSKPISALRVYWLNDLKRFMRLRSELSSAAENVYACNHESEKVQEAVRSLRIAMQDVTAAQMNLQSAMLNEFPMEIANDS